LRGGEPGLEPAFNGAIIGKNIGGLGGFHNNQGDLPKFRQPVTSLEVCLVYWEGKIIPIALKPYGFKAIGKRAKCQRLFLLGLAPWGK